MNRIIFNGCLLWNRGGGIEVRSKRHVKMNVHEPGKPKNPRAKTFEANTTRGADADFAMNMIETEDGS